MTKPYCFLLLLLFVAIASCFSFPSTGRPVPVQVQVQVHAKKINRTTAKRRAVVYPTSRPENSNSLHSLHSLPPTFPWVVAHVISGASGAPIVATATRRESGWYRKIHLSVLTPPDAVFAPIWTLLYALMGIAVGRVYHLAQSPSRTFALSAWAIHMILNLSWAPIFFGFQQLRLGLFVNVALWLSLVGAVLPSYYMMSAPTAFLLLPYAAWLTFANILNWDICRLNPTKQGYNNAKFQAQLATLQQQAAKYAGL